MKFEEALQELRKGKSIKRECFVNYMNMELMKNLHVELLFSDIIQDDWIVYEEPGKTFPEVFEAFKSHKKIRRKAWDDLYYFQKTESTIHSIDEIDLLANDWEIIND